MDTFCNAVVLNFGSLNIDSVYQVPHFILPGETLACTAFSQNAGGKGLNQSLALAKAGVHVFHAGKIGPDGEFLLNLLKGQGVDVSHIVVGDVPTGQAIIEVDAGSGNNRILLFPGANTQMSETEINRVFDSFASQTPRDERWLLLQNEMNALPQMMDKAHSLGFKIAFNPSPFTPEILKYPLDAVTLFFVNEIEAAGLSGMDIDSSPAEMAQRLTRLYPYAQFVITLGSRGAVFVKAGISAPVSVPAEKVNAVDTTAAGDTFTGYFLACYLQTPNDPERALFYANKAAAISVTVAGAAKSIPMAEQVFEK